MTTLSWGRPAGRPILPSAKRVGWGDAERCGGSRSEATEISVRTQYILYTSVFLATTVISIYLVIHYWQQIVRLQSYGYLGMFLVAFVAGSSIPTPVSYLLLTFTFGGILNPALVGLSAGAGAGVGGTLVYLLGRGGRRFFPGLKHFSVDEEASTRLADRFARWTNKRGSLVVFLMSAMLNPVFAPMAIAMGALHFRLVKFFAMCVAGNVVKALVVAYLGYLGIAPLLRLFG